MEEKRLKLDIQKYLINVKPYVNLSAIARKIGITKQVISYFLRDESHLEVISLNKLIQIKDFIQNL